MEERAKSSRPPPRRWGDGPFRFGQKGRKRRNGRREWAQGRRLEEDDRRQRCAGMVGSWARMGEQFNGLLNTMPATAWLCLVYCVRTASVRRRVDGQSGCCLRRADGRQMVGQAGARGRGSAAIREGHAIAPGGSAGARKSVWAIQQRQFGSRGFSGGAPPRLGVQAARPFSMGQSLRQRGRGSGKTVGVSQEGVG